MAGGFFTKNDFTSSSEGSSWSFIYELAIFILEKNPQNKTKQKQEKKRK